MKVKMAKAVTINGQLAFVDMNWWEITNHRWVSFLFRHSKSLAWFWIKKEARRQLQQARDGPAGTAIEIRKALIESWAKEWAEYGLHSKTWYELQLRGFNWWD